jgi:hypothetical protein
LAGRDLEDGSERSAVPAPNRVKALTAILVATRLRFGEKQVPGTALGVRGRLREIPVIYIPLDAERAVHADASHGAVLEPFTMTELLETAQRLAGVHRFPSGPT